LNANHRTLSEVNPMSQEYTSGKADSDTAEGWLDDPEYVGAATAHRWIEDHNASWDEFLEDCPNAVVIGKGIMSDTIFKWLGY